MISTTAAATAMGRSSNKLPFTATQWQELEHQALIYKYMAAGVPIPPALLFTIKRSLDSSISSKFFPTYHPTPLGWNGYNQIQMGYGKKIDPEPGRCRRTDGKKWRCSKEAYPDSKYCERHMHRGKNRSRKPVEISNPDFTTNNNSSSTTTSNNNCVTIASSSPATNNICSINSTSLTHQSLMTTTTPSKTYPTSSLYSLSSLPSTDPPYNSLFSHPYYSHKYYTSRDRYFHGLKEEVGEHAFFTENSSSSMRAIEESWQLGGYNCNPNNHQMKQQEKQCYIWGRDFNTDLSKRRVEEERENNNDKTTHHFLDEWPLKAGGGGGGGVGRGDKDSSSWHESPSTTQLSISIPTSTASHQHHHDFFLSNSRTYHHDG